MKIDYLDIADNGFAINVKTQSKDDIEILKEVLHGILSANFQLLYTFDDIKFPIGIFRLEYDYEAGQVTIEH